MKWVPRFAEVWLSLLLSSVTPGWQISARGGERAARLFTVRSRLDFLPSLVVFFWGGVCLFLPLPPWAAACTSQ